MFINLIVHNKDMIAIIGAGPVGSYAGYLLAKQGHKVRIFEEHNMIGKPVQCTGITTDAIHDVIKVDDSIIVNKVSVSRVFSPGNGYVDIKMSKDDYIFDRAGLDNYIAEMALNAGAEIVYGKRFTGYKEEDGRIIALFNNDRLQVDYLIGADGVNSSVARAMGRANRKFLYGTQARVRLDVEDRRIFEAYMGIGDFAWVVPEDEKIARIGIIGNRESARQFMDFIKARNGRIIEYQGGLVPLYDPGLRVQKGNVMLIGDAATQVKPTTYGGIVPGMLAARELAKDIENYESNMRKTVGKQLLLGLYIRRLMNRFSSKDYDYMIKLCRQERVLRILNNLNRDYPGRSVFKLLLAEPRFLRYLVNLAA